MMTEFSIFKFKKQKKKVCCIIIIIFTFLVFFAIHLSITCRSLLKIKVLYWHQWFHKEALPSMETFHSTKDSLLWKEVL